jgi:hypothetical protein
VNTELEKLNTISLCVIAGREEKTITRMLDSFVGTFDELVLVIATGSKPDDNTETLARAWCDRNLVAFESTTYNNAAHAEDWPHVDDFAAARNLAFALAGSRWLLWADCDDVFTGDAEALREFLENDDATDIHHFGYDVSNAGKLVKRERLIRASTLRDGAAWYGAIHENFRACSTHKQTKHDETWWLHEPIAEKRPSSDRNLRILSHTLNDAPTYAFYVHQDHFLNRDREKAQKWGDVFLSFPVSDASLRYQAHLNLSAIATRHSEASRHALAAYWLFPHREAIAALVNCAFQENEAEKALHFAKLLIATPEPTKPLWCHEPRWYGWHGWDLYSRALRLAGVHDQRYGGESILLLHETDESDARFVQDRDLWMTSAKNPHGVFHLFSVPDDQIDSKWFKSFAREKRSEIDYYVGDHWDDVKKIEPGDVPTIGWDEQFENEKL